MQPGATPGAILELHAAKASGGTAPGSNDPLTTQWYDTSGNGNHGTLTNFTGTPWSADRLTFDGVDDYVACPDIGAVEDKTFTYEAWIERAPSGGSHYILSEAQAGGTRVSGLLVSSNVLRYYSNAWSGKSGSVVVGDSAVHHVAAVADGSVLQLYADGGKDGTTLSLANSAPGVDACFIGVQGANMLAYWPGAIYLARIYPFALTPEQVAANYAAGLEWVEPIQRRPSGLLVYQSGRSTLSWQ